MVRNYACNWVSPERQEYGQFLPKLRGRETQLTTY